MEAVLRVSAYHRRDFDLAAISFSLQDCADTTTMLLSPALPPTVTLGMLDQLPVELLSAILLELDLASLVIFRHVNRRAREVINSLREYKLIATHASNCVCAMLWTGSASGITLSHLYHLMCQELCSTCQQSFGDMLNLLTWQRCCSACLRAGSSEVAAVTVGSAKKALRLSAPSIKRLHTLKTKPGIYTMEETPYKRSLHITSLQSVRSLYHAEHAGSELPISMASPQPHLAFMSCTTFPLFNPRTVQIQVGMSCAGCQLAMEETRPTTDAMVKHRDMVYSPASFLRHYENCKPAQRIWEASNNGSLEPPNLPQLCRQGGYFSDRICRQQHRNVNGFKSLKG